MILNAKPVVQFGKVTSYITTVSLNKLHSIKGNIQYNHEAQRGLDDKNKPMIDKKHVNKICQAFLNKEAIRGHLTWNINEDCVRIDKDTIYLEKDVKITIPDSAHRHFALFKAYEEAVKMNEFDILNSQFVVEIFFLDKNEEKEYFSTINGKTKQVYRNRSLYLSNDIECRLLREAIENSSLCGKVETMKSRATDKLVKFSTLYDAFIGSGDFKVNEENYDETVQWLTKFFTVLCNTRPEFLLEDKKESKNDSMAVEEITWWGYSLLAKNLQDDVNWKRTLKHRMNKKVSLDGGKKADFFSKALYLWHGSIIKGVYNPITQTTDYGSSVYNSSATRSKIRNIFINNIL